MSYISGKVIANVAGSSVPTLGSGQTYVGKYVSGNGSNQTIHTVTTGKTFYLYSISVAMGAAGIGKLFANDGTTAVACLGGTAANASATVNGGGAPLAVYTSGTAVIVNFAGTPWISVTGVEQ